jgi:hypothetical protein
VAGARRQSVIDPEMEVLLDRLDLLEGLLAWVIHASDKRNHISVSLAIKCLHMLVADLRDGILTAFMTGLGWRGHMISRGATP